MTMQPLAGPKTKFKLHRGRNRHRLAQPSPPIPHLTRCPCQRCARPLEDMEVDR